MVKVQSEKTKKGKINYVVRRDSEKAVGHRIKVVGIARDKSKPYKKEIEEMQNEEC